jgi:hypothetical protein
LPWAESDEKPLPVNAGIQRPDISGSDFYRQAWHEAAHHIFFLSPWFFRPLIHRCRLADVPVSILEERRPLGRASFIR